MPNSSREKTVVADGISLTTASWRIPFRSVEPLVWALDCVIILASSLLSGFAYHRWMLGGSGIARSTALSDSRIDSATTPIQIYNFRL